MGKLFALQRAGAIRLMVTVSTILEYQRPGEEVDVRALDARLKALGLDSEAIFTHPRPMPFSTPSEPNTTTFGADLEMRLHQAVHEILFRGRTEPDAKNVDFSWYAYRDRECQRRGITGSDHAAIAALDYMRMHRGWQLMPHMPALDGTTPEKRAELSAIVEGMHRTWMNAKNDAEGLYIHANHAVYTTVSQHAVFVTSDMNFKRWNNTHKQTNWERVKALGFPGHILEPAEAYEYYQKLAGAMGPDTD